MTPRHLSSIAAALAAALLLAGCGGAGPRAGRAEAASAPDPDPAFTADDLVPRAVLASAELTTAADEERYVATAEARTEFAPGEPQIFLVGKLKRVPTQARIEVRWFRDADPRPLLVSEVNGSDTFSFVATLRPAAREFVPGPYTARIFVDDREVGGAPFRILGVAPSQDGPKASELAISPAVGAKMKPKRASAEYEPGVKRLYATFAVQGAPEGATASVLWMRNGAVFHEEELEIAAAGRFGAELASPDGLPDGTYSVEVIVPGADPIAAGFTVGDPSSGPRVDRIELGRALGDDNLPEAVVTEFRRDEDAIRCGLRFLDIPPGSEIVLQWLAVPAEEGGEPALQHTTRSALPDGGSGTMGAEWRQPDGGFEPGSYKVVVTVGDAPLAEVGFTIQ